jgi:hypothetical protein
MITNEQLLFGGLLLAELEKGIDELEPQESYQDMIDYMVDIKVKMIIAYKKSGQKEILGHIEWLDEIIDRVQKKQNKNASSM